MARTRITEREVSLLCSASQAQWQDHLPLGHGARGFRPAHLGRPLYLAAAEADGRAGRNVQALYHRRAPGDDDRGGPQSRTHRARVSVNMQSTACTAEAHAEKSQGVRQESPTLSCRAWAAARRSLSPVLPPISVQLSSPCFRASSASFTSGRAPTWEMISAAARLPRRPAVSRSLPVATPNRNPAA